MRIGHYMTGLGAPGGIGSYVRRVSAAQRDAGHDVTLFDCPAPGERPCDGATCVTDDAALHRAAAECRLDVLHVHTHVVPGDGPVIVRTLHGHEPYCPSGGRYLAARGRPCDRRFSHIGCTWGHLVDRCGSMRPAQLLAGFRRTHAERRDTRQISVIAVSRFLRDQMIRNGYDPRRVHTLANPAAGEAPPYEPPPHDGVPRFVFLGRVTPTKGADWLLRAAARVGRGVHLDIAGDGNAMPVLRQLSEELNVSDVVTFHGWLDASGIARLLRGARALVFPSLWHEPAGLVALDAMTHGRAVIASAVGGIPEIVADGSTGLLVPPNDVDALAAAMRALADDHDRAAALGHAGRDAARARFSLAAHLDGLTALYERAIAGDA